MKQLILGSICALVLSSASCDAGVESEVETQSHALTVGAPWGAANTGAALATVRAPAIGIHTNRAAVLWYRWTGSAYECWVDPVSPDHLIRSSIQINFGAGHDYLDTIRWWEELPCGTTPVVVTFGPPAWAGPYSLGINMGAGFDNAVLRHGPPGSAAATLDGWTGDDWLYVDVSTKVNLLGWDGDDRLISLQNHAGVNINGEAGLDCLEAPPGLAARMDCGPWNDFVTAGVASVGCEFAITTCN